MPLIDDGIVEPPFFLSSDGKSWIVETTDDHLRLRVDTEKGRRRAWYSVVWLQVFAVLTFLGWFFGGFPWWSLALCELAIATLVSIQLFVYSEMDRLGPLLEIDRTAEEVRFPRITMQYPLNKIRQWTIIERWHRSHGDQFALCAVTDDGKRIAIAQSPYRPTRMEELLDAINQFLRGDPIRRETR